VTGVQTCALPISYNAHQTREYQAKSTTSRATWKKRNVAGPPGHRLRSDQ
jgi:hypothetical protein